MKINKYQKIGIISRYTEFKRNNFEESNCIKHALEPYFYSRLLKETAEKELKKLIVKNQHLINNTQKTLIFDHEFTV